MAYLIFQNVIFLTAIQQCRFLLKIVMFLKRIPYFFTIFIEGILLMNQRQFYKTGYILFVNSRQLERNLVRLCFHFAFYGLQ